MEGSTDGAYRGGEGDGSARCLSGGAGAAGTADGSWDASGPSVGLRAVAYAMSEDHKPEDPLELARVEAAGGEVIEGRIEGNLNLSRAIGDLYYKRNARVKVEEQMISALPDVTVVALEPDDRFVVLACDGIWNVMGNQEVVDFVAERLDRGMAVGAVCEDVLDNCLAPPNNKGDGSGCDNMTMMVVVLPAQAARSARAPRKRAGSLVTYPELTGEPSPKAPRSEKTPGCDSELLPAHS